MMIKRRVLILSLFVFINLHSAVDAQFQALETKHQRLLYFGEIHGFIVPYTAQCFENALKYHHSLFDYTPGEKITVLLHDFNDYGNAGADVVPKNNIVIGIAPYRYVYDTSPANERMNSTMNHELVHILAMDMAAGSDHFYRSLFFGKVKATEENPLSMFYAYMTTPRRYAPRWYHEGLAVFWETWMAGGLGRAQSAYDEMVFRTMILDSSHIYNLIGLESEGTQVDFQVGVNSYLYGTRFMSYLAYQYEPEKLIQWIKRSPGSSAHFSNQFENVYQKNLYRAWDQWILWERDFQKSNLESIRNKPLTAYHPIIDESLGSVSRMYYNANENKLYSAIRYPGQIAHIASIDITDKSVEKICDIKGPALYYVSSIAYDSSSGSIFYTTDNNHWRDLEVVDIASGKSTILIKDARIGDLTFNHVDKSLWGIRHYNGLSSIVRFLPPYDEWDLVYVWPYGKDIFDIDISPDGRYLSGALIDISGNQRLILMNVDSLLGDTVDYETLYNFEQNTPANFVFSKDGKYLYGTSYYSGVSNAYRYDLQLDDISIISNCQTGFFRPLPVSDDSLIVLRYSGEGFSPVKISSKIIDQVDAISFLGKEIEKKHPVVTRWIADSPASINIDSLTVYKGNYNTFSHIQVASLYPIVEGYKDYPSFGLRLDLAGPVGLHNLKIAGSYSPNTRLAENERWHLNMGYNYLDWEIEGTYNRADFYDLFGPTKVSRKGYSLAIQYEKSLIFDQPIIMEYRIRAAGYGGLEELPGYQNISTTHDKLFSVSFEFNYEHLRKSLGAVDNEKGFKLEVIPSANYANKVIYPRIFTTLDLGFALPIKHSSVWLRSATGYSYGDREEPFANFYFGGFRNNWVDYQAEQRYRKFYTFPGIDINDVGGTNFFKLMLEWAIPPIRFRNLGYSSLYAPWLRTAIFASGLSTNVDNDSYRRILSNLGIQADLRIMALSHLKTTLSLGYAMAWEDNKKVSHEFMISLKIL